MLLLYVCRKAFHTYWVCISQKVNSVIMQNFWKTKILVDFHASISVPLQNFFIAGFTHHVEENRPPRSLLLRGCSGISHMVERLLLLKRSAVLKTLKTMRIVKFRFDKATSSRPKTYYHKGNVSYCYSCSLLFV